MTENHRADVLAAAQALANEGSEENIDTLRDALGRYDRFAEQAAREGNSALDTLREAGLGDTTSYLGSLKPSSLRAIDGGAE